MMAEVAELTTAPEVAAAAAAGVVRFGVIVIGAEFAGSVEAFRPPPTPEMFFFRCCCGGLFATGVLGVKKVDDDEDVDDDLPVPARLTSAGWFR